MATGHSVGAHRSLVGIKVLVAEDEFLIAADVAIALRDLGCIVLGPAASSEEALALLERARPDIGLLDVRLTDGDAGPIASALTAVGVPFAVTTGYLPDGVTDPLLHAAPQLDKPYGTAELERTMLQLLAAR